MIFLFRWCGGGNVQTYSLSVIETADNNNGKPYGGNGAYNAAILGYIYILLTFFLQYTTFIHHSICDFFYTGLNLKVLLYTQSKI